MKQALFGQQQENRLRLIMAIAAAESAVADYEHREAILPLKEAHALVA